MKKRLVSVLLTACMLAALMPQALAVSDSGNNDTADTAQSLSVGDTIYGSISVNGDVDYYVFTLKESGAVTLDITSYMRWYSMHIYDISGTNIWKETGKEYNSTVGFRSDKYVVDLSSGTYYLKISGQGYWSSEFSTGEYTIGTTFVSANVNESEVNDSALTANTVSIGNTIKGQIAVNNDIDYYKFTLTTSGRVTLSITSYMRWYSLYIYDTSGAVLWSAADKEYNETVGFRSDDYPVDLPAGTYYLKVTGNGYWSSNISTGNYTIKTAFTDANVNESENNDTAMTANEVSVGSTIRGQISVNGDVDYYKFTVTNSELTIDITSYMQWYSLYIYDVSGAKVWSAEDKEYNSTAGFRSDKYEVNLDAGTYYLMVNGRGYWSSETSTGTYTIELGSGERTIPVTGVTLNNRSLSMTEGDQETLRATVSPSNASNPNVTWSSNNTSVATVTSSGRVTAVAAGTATITVRTADGGYTAQCTVTVAKKASEVPDKPGAFRDVSPSAYYYDAVVWAVENDITAGATSTTFNPNGACTRAQIVTFLWRSAGEPRPTSTYNPFTDVKASDYYYDAVLWAVGKGITSGTSTSAFSPNTACSRAQAVTFLYRAENSPSSSGRNSFSDVASSAYYSSAVAWAVANNITSGTGNNKFSPNDTCNRAQIVTFLYRDMA